MEQSHYLRLLHSLEESELQALLVPHLPLLKQASQPATISLSLHWLAAFAEALDKASLFPKSVALEAPLPIPLGGGNPEPAQAATAFFRQLFPGSPLLASQELDEDFSSHFNFLKEAIQAESFDLFLDYILWMDSILTSRNLPTASLVRMLVCCKLKASAEENRYLNQGIQRLLQPQEAPREEAGDTLPSDALKYLQLLLKGKRHEATQFVFDKLQEGFSIREIYLDIFQQSQREVGRLWEKNQLSVAQEHYCTATTQQIMSQLYPHILTEKRNGLTMVACSVGNELHEIGVRMVADFLEMDGWNTYYIGANAPLEAILSAIKENKADLLALSVTLTPHIKMARRLIQAIRENKELSPKIMVGGYPFLADPDLWKKIGADGFAMSAAEVNQVAIQLIEQDERA